MVRFMYSSPLHDAAQIGSKGHSLDVAFSKAGGYGEIPGVGTRHLLQESGTEIRRSVRSADGARKGAISVLVNGCARPSWGCSLFG